MLIDDFTHATVGRIARYALEHQRRGTVCQRTVNDIAMAGHPTHVRRTPVDFALLIVEHILMRHGGVSQVTAGSVLQAFRRAGGA